MHPNRSDVSASAPLAPRSNPDSTRGRSTNRSRSGERCFAQERSQRGPRRGANVSAACKHRGKRVPETTALHYCFPRIVGMTSRQFQRSWYDRLVDKIVTAEAGKSPSPRISESYVNQADNGNQELAAEMLVFVAGCGSFRLSPDPEVAPSGNSARSWTPPGSISIANDAAPTLAELRTIDEGNRLQ